MKQPNRSNILKMMPPSCQALLQGRKYGLMATNLTKKKCNHNGRHHHLHQTEANRIKNRDKADCILRCGGCGASRISLKRLCFEMPSVTNHAKDVHLVRGICSLTMCRFQQPKVSGSSWSSIAPQCFPSALLIGFSSL